MKKQTRFIGILVALAILVLASVACSFSAVDVSKDGATISVGLEEDDLNRMLKESNDKVEDKDVILREITEVDMHDGFLRIFGTYEKPDGRDAEGSYDVKFDTRDGKLYAEIIGVDIEGVEMGDARIQHLNEEMANALDKSARESKGEVEYESVKVTDEEFSIVVKTHWEVE